MTPDTEPVVSAAPPLQKKPRLAFLLATWFGLGYLPKAPGTWGSLAGLVLCGVVARLTWVDPFAYDFPIFDRYSILRWDLVLGCCLIIGATGVWSSSRVTSFTGKKDPQFVVIDEVSGQMIALFAGALFSKVFFSGLWNHSQSRGLFFYGRWTVFIASFLLFRLFDIWKPWPIRKLESLPGGWGIMADDWLAGIYAAILLRLALHFNVL
jgi:phosphatidylglycerophosphatase A